MSTPAAPTMSTAGYLTAIEPTMDFLFRCFLASERSQSAVFDIKSLPYLVQKHGGDNDGLLSAVQDTLHSLFGQYFDSVVCSVTGDVYVEEPAVFHMVISMSVWRNGTLYDLSNAVKRDPSGRFYYEPVR